ncbi:MAG: Na+/H+ antiporter subunit E [Proteobacteria bacterium]|nr:Na+/H+ antiporter subunit E [Pseudomonadota bacterium]
MKRVARSVSPFLVLALTAVWLLLNQTLDLAQIALGAVLAVGLAWSASALRPVQTRLRRLDVALALTMVVLADIVSSSVAVGRLVLAWGHAREFRPGFLTIPIELRNPYGLAALAVIVTSTPGTVWAGLSPAGDALTLHVLDLKDEDEWIRHFKQRYERPLTRIFQ